MTFQTSPVRPVTEAEIETFWNDGVVHLPGILERGDVATMTGPVDRLVDHPDALADMSAMAVALGASDAPGGRFVSGVDHWLDDPEFAAFAIDSALPAIAAALLQSTKVNLYEDSLLVKEPGALEPTVLHQDLAYFHVEGEQICTMWIPLDAVDQSSGAVHYVVGSHADGRLYRPNYFISNDVLPDTEGEFIPEVTDTDLTCFSTVPGDVVVHHARTLHGASANSSTDRRRRAISVRYCGDDARYRMRPGAPRKAHHTADLDGSHLDHARCPVVWPR